MPKQLHPTITSLQAENMSKTCSAPGCTKLRHGISKYCYSHKQRATLYGSPLGESSIQVGKGNKPLRYQRELSFTKDLIIKNSDSKPVIAARQLLREYINAGKNGLDVPGKRHLVKFPDEIEPQLLQMLSELSAFWIWSKDTKAMSDKETIFGLANVFARFQPKEYKYSYLDNGRVRKSRVSLWGARDRETVGQYLRNMLGVFFMNIHKVYLDNQSYNRNIKRDLCEPIRN